MITPEDAANVADETAALYQQAELLIIAAMTARIKALGDAPNWLLAQQLEERRLRAHVAGIASVVSEKSSPLVAAALVDAYEIGRKAAEKELAAHGVDAVRVGLTGSVEEAARSRVVIERAGIELMSNLNTQLSHVPHTVMDGWRKIVTEVSTDLLRGDVSPMDAARKAHTRFAREGYGFFVDKAGRRWGLDTYAEMAVRSAANDLMIDAHSAALVAAGEDLVIVSSHRNPAPQCAPYERRVLSLTGRYARGSQRVRDSIVNVKATLDEARARGFQHPNAILGGGQAIDTFAESVGASKSAYAGPAVSIRTAQGDRATVSPNHPVLTSRGWVTAQTVRKGDYVFRSAPGEFTEPGIPVESNLNKMPSTVEQEFSALKSLGTESVIPTAGLKFNDDRDFIKGEVNVVVTDDCLLPVPDVHVIKETGEVLFQWSDMQPTFSPGDSSLSLYGLTIGGAISGALSHVDAHFTQSSKQRRPGDSEVVGEVLAAVPREVHAAEVVGVDVFSFEGHAYDFQTASGVYSLNSIIVHNCRHTISLYQPGVTPVDAPTPDPDHAGYKATQHQRYLERQIRASKQMEAAAVTQEDKRVARARARNYQARLREHVREWDLPRRRHREQVRVPDWTE